MNHMQEMQMNKQWFHLLMYEGLMIVKRTFERHGEVWYTHDALVNEDCFQTRYKDDLYICKYENKCMKSHTQNKCKMKIGIWYQVFVGKLPSWSRVTICDSDEVDETTFDAAVDAPLLPATFLPYSINNTTKNVRFAKCVCLKSCVRGVTNVVFWWIYKECIGAWCPCILLDLAIGDDFSRVSHITIWPDIYYTNNTHKIAMFIWVVIKYVDISLCCFVCCLFYLPK